MEYTTVQQEHGLHISDRKWRIIVGVNKNRKIRHQRFTYEFIAMVVIHMDLKLHMELKIDHSFAKSFDFNVNSAYGRN